MMKRQSRSSKAIRRNVLIVGLALVLSASVAPEPSGAIFAVQVGGSPAIAQTPPNRQLRYLRTRDIAPRVYERLPNLPRENAYERQASSDSGVDHTLVYRLIQYHLEVKQRLPIYRLDWKLTLADYLGANERMDRATYPGASTLETNPLAGDREAIRNMTRSQRNDLVQTLVDLYTVSALETDADSFSNPAVERSSPRPTVSPAPITSPGAAELLLP
jgi:hypothetical protein